MMPEFTMDTAGEVDNVMVVGAVETGLSLEWSDLDSFTQGYLEACFFTECSPAFDSEEWESGECQQAQEDGQADGTLPGDAGFSNLHPDSLAAAIRYCANWQQANRSLLDEAYARDGYDATRAGHDLWFTANGHGVGYRSREELKCDSEEYERLTQAIIEARDDSARWSRLVDERNRLSAGSLGDRLANAARYCEIHTFFQDGRVYLEGFPSC